VSVDAARAVLPNDLFEPVSVRGDALVQVTALQYDEASIGAYSEFGVMVMVHRSGSTPSRMRMLMSLANVEDAGWYVVNLAVSTGFACAAGRELWGYPGYVTQVDTEFDRDEVQVILNEELVLEHRSRFGITVPGRPFVYFSELEGRLLRTVVPVEHNQSMGGARSVRIQLTGDGPTADMIRQLGLDRRRPMFAARADHVKLTLPLGVPIGSVPVRIS
jgi:Acetoacetate decarboxylase (ADC)